MSKYGNILSLMQNNLDAAREVLADHDQYDLVDKDLAGERAGEAYYIVQRLKAEGWE